MQYNRVCVESFGYELPENIVTSLSLEERLAPIYSRLNLRYGRLEMMTGIRERRFWNDGVTPSQASIRAAEKAISKSGVSREDIGCLLYTSVSVTSWSQLQRQWSMTHSASLTQLPFSISPMLVWVSSTAW
jgi:acyl-CoA:acyl-CoA alkyltransferase